MIIRGGAGSVHDEGGRRERTLRRGGRGGAQPPWSLHRTNPVDNVGRPAEVGDLVAVDRSTVDRPPRASQQVGDGIVGALPDRVTGGDMHEAGGGCVLLESRAGITVTIGR